jgi:hypothetical protein
MFQLIGVPGDLFLLLNEATHLATMPYDWIVIEDLEARVRSWNPPPSPEFLSPKNAMLADDFLHACLAWKASILIYISRVFRATEAADRVQQRLVRECLTNVSSIVAGSILKQLVWSMFVAGSEIVVDEMKNVVRRIFHRVREDIGCLFVRDAEERLEKLWEMRNCLEVKEREAWWADVLVAQAGEYYFFG